MDDEAQVVIPDLDEDEALVGLDGAPTQPWQSPGGSQAGSTGRQSPLEDAMFHGGGLFKAPPRSMRHAHTGSLSQDDASSVATKSSFRFGASFSHAFPGLEVFHSPTRPTEKTQGFSFPVKKSSFASLRAAIKGQPGASARDESADASARARRQHHKTGSQAALDGDTSSGGAPRTPPAFHVHHRHNGSQFSETSVDARSISPTSLSGLGPVGVDADVGEALDAAARRGGARAADGALGPPAARPIDLAMDQVLARFTALAATVVDAVLQAPPELEALAAMFPVPTQQQALNEVLESLAHMARPHGALVAARIFAWRTTAMGPALLRTELRRPSESSLHAAGAAPDDTRARRRTLAVTYLTCCALSAAVAPDGAEDGADALGDEGLRTLLLLLHQCSVERQREQDAVPRLLTTLQQQCFDHVARLLGDISKHRCVERVRR
ncbi:hypothetical protein MSPP1_001223 [Malassezia sp. CBS 17886]|nr:hypothetical protein MSPP1_001223 [Malassezia sp. CBS 17886]